MRIKKVHLRNGYKRFHDLTIDLGENPARLVVLVGPNGCGKSSVFDGILHFQNLRQRIGDQNPKGVAYHKLNQASKIEVNDIIINTDGGALERVHQKKQAIGKGNTLIAFRSSYRYNTALKVAGVSAMSDIKNNDYGATVASDLDAKMISNFSRLNIKFNDYIKREDCKPSEGRAKIIGDLNRSLSNCLDLTISDIGDIQASRGTLYFTKPDHPNEFEFDVLSAGEKEVVDLLLDLYLRQDDYDDTVFLIDEPELHISTRIQRLLLVEIDRLIGDNCQIWITTHSIGFMRAIQEHYHDDCQVIHFPGEYQYASQAYTLEPVSLTAATWRDLFEIALDDLAHLICPKRIVYCEGRDRPGANGAERGLDAKVLNTVFATTHPDTLFVSSGGNTELDQRSEIAIAILGKVFSEVEILVLKDRDMASGKETTENDRKVYLKANPDNHRVLKRWEIENYLFDAEVLRGYCAENSLPFDEKEYEILTQDVVNQDLKSELPRIKNICGIKSSISAEKFKLELSKHVPQDSAVYRDLESSIFERD